MHVVLKIDPKFNLPKDL